MRYLKAGVVLISSFSAVPASAENNFGEVMEIHSAILQVCLRGTASAEMQARLEELDNKLRFAVFPDDFRKINSFLERGRSHNDWGPFCRIFQ